MRPDIIIGSKGWRYDAWVGGFYPDDMPKEWWFSYYSNEFETVLVPTAYLTRFDLPEWQSWYDDAPETFKFYVELSSTTQWGQALNYLKVLGDHLGGIIISLHEPAVSPDLLILAEHAARLAPVSIDVRSCETTTKCEMTTKYDTASLSQQLQVNVCWRHELQAVPQWGYSPQAVAMRYDNFQDSPAELRNLLEVCIKFAGSQGTVTLFFDGSSPKIEDMQNAAAINLLL